MTGSPGAPADTGANTGLKLDVDGAVATADVRLMHVHQGEKVTSAAFPDEVDRALQSLKLSPGAAAAWGPTSRKIEIKRR